MEDELSFLLNGRQHRVAGVDPHESLLSYLRRSGLTGAKEGCAEGECGACAVAFRPAGTPAGGAYEAVNACLMPVLAARDGEVWTVEGITPSKGLHPVQAAMAGGGGSQCGYCTPGFVVSLFAQYYRPMRLPTLQALSGNLCRCTGYRPIRDAAEQLPVVCADDPFTRRLSTAVQAPQAHSYVAHGVRYDQPVELDQALSSRAQFPQARVVAGATDVGVEINQAAARSAHFIAIDRIEALRAHQLTDEHVVLGAAMTLAELEDGPAAEVPMMEQWLPLFASRLIRARATLGGNLATASPIGDAAPLLLALDAQVELQSLRGCRWVDLRDFFVGYRRTALAPDELLTAIRLPRRPPSHGRFYKVSKRRLDDISCVSSGFALWVEDGRITRARLAYGGVAATPLRALDAERALAGKPFERASFDAARATLAGAFTPIDDVRGSARYRQQVVQNLLERFCCEVLP